MQTGSPPPWLHHMQRVGMPPSYQTLRIPGMNAPRPPGTEYGYHPGGWGQPPLDEYGNALFPEAFSEPVEYDRMEFPLLEGNHWGVLAKEEYESSEEEKESSEEEEEEEEAMAALAGVEISAAPVQEEDTDLSGIETPLSGMETPSNIEATLRKTKKNKELYTVLEQRETSVSSGELYGSSHLYVVPSKKDKKQSSSTATVDLMKSQRTEEIELSLDPSEIPDLTEDALAKKFDREMADRKKKESQGQGEGDKKRKRTTSSSSQPKKKKKKDDFKF
jgi:splicing factor 3B subunit 2